MKKVILIAIAGLLVTGIGFADTGKKKSKGAKGKTCSAKQSCHKDKAKTVKI